MRRPFVLVLACSAAWFPATAETTYSDIRIVVSGHLSLPGCPVSRAGYEEGCDDPGATFSAIGPWLGPDTYRPPELCELYAEGHGFPIQGWSVGGCGFGSAAGEPGRIGIRLADEPTPLPGGGCRFWHARLDENVAASELFFLVGLGGITMRSGRITMSNYQRHPAGDSWIVTANLVAQDSNEWGTSRVTFELGGIAFSATNCDAGDEVGEVSLVLEGFGTGEFST